MDLALKFNQKPYWEVGICRNHIRTILLVYFDILHRPAVLAQEIAFLLMGDCSVHISDDVICILTEARACVIIFAPHPTHIFQLLVLTRVGVPKGCPRYELPFDDDNATVKVILRVYYDFTQISV
jgi:hypothetical protein